MTLRQDIEAIVFHSRIPKDFKDGKYQGVQMPLSKAVDAIIAAVLERVPEKKLYTINDDWRFQMRADARNSTILEIRSALEE